MLDKFENLVISYKCKTWQYVARPNGRFENLVISYKCKTTKLVGAHNGECESFSVNLIFKYN